METFAASTERGRRTRWWRILLWMLALGLAVASATLAIGWMAFHQLRSDLADSNARLPAKVGSDRVGELTTRGNVTALVGALAQEGIPVNHVLLLAPGQIGNMIDALGGIAVSAPTGVTLLDTSGRSFGIRPGQIRLKGALADAYLFGQEQGDPTASPEQRQLDGLAAVGAAVLEPSSATLRTPNHLGGVIAKNTATDLTATTYLDELHAWGDVSRTVSCSTVDSSGDATSILAGKGAASAGPATCSTASVRPSAWFRTLGLLGSAPADMLVLVGGLALLGAGICLLALELSSPGFRTLRDRRRRGEAEAGPSQTAAPSAVSVPSVSPPPAERRRPRLPHPLRRPGHPHG